MKHFFLAVREFIARYAEVFKAAWSIRATLDPPKRTQDELAFLPAHLELTDTPVSPASRWVMRTIMAFFSVALLWACIGQLEIVAVAQGKTVVSTRTKVVQSAETALVRRILVEDGQRVRKGDLLIELDASATHAELEQANKAHLDAQVLAARLTAFAAALDGGRPPHIAATDGLPQARIASAQALVSSQFDAFRAHQQALQAAIAQRKAERSTLQATIRPLTQNATIASDRAKDYARLLEGHYVGRHDYLLREQERIAAERELATQQHRLQELHAAILAAEDELRVLVTDTRQKTLDGLREAQAQLAQLAPQVSKTQQRNRQMTLRAPVDGTVQQLAVHTIGGVVTPAQPLLLLVPSAEGLEVEATILNKDIGFVKPGQAVTIKVESFPYTRYGYLEGVVETVSHDAAQNEQLGLVFPARIKVNNATLMIDGTPITLSAGMSLSVEIKTGKRRVIDYLLSPLQVHVSEAMRER